MAFFRSKTTKQLDKEIGHDLDKYQSRLQLSLVRLTPIDTGNAQKGWRKVADMSDVLNTGKNKIIIRNDVEYIQKLDDGHSRQAPRGIVNPALQQTRK
jgi:hypothetical protein